MEEESENLVVLIKKLEVAEKHLEEGILALFFDVVLVELVESLGFLVQSGPEGRERQEKDFEELWERLGLIVEEHLE